MQTNNESHPQRIKFNVVRGLRKPEIARWAEQHLAAGTHVISDGLKCFNAVTQACCGHQAVISRGSRADVEKPEFNWVKTVLCNLKIALRSSYHSFDPKYAFR